MTPLESLNQLVLNKADPGKLTLFLTTFGGRAHAAYRLTQLAESIPA